MTDQEFAAEHKKIVKVLRKGSKAEREKEAKKQQKEANERKRGGK
jgi:hypothetical protein